MAVKMNLRIITKRFAADPKIGFLTKSISKANGYATAMPPAWELKIGIKTLLKIQKFHSLQFCTRKLRFIKL